MRFSIAAALSLPSLTLLPQALPPPARAAEKSQDRTPEEETILFQEIPSVYGASKYEQKITEAPSSVSIVTAEEIARYGYRTLAAILRSVRGFTTSYDRNYHYLGVRGFSRPGDYNSRFLLLVNGHRLNDNIYSSAYVGTEFILDVDLIDRVEVVRGPSSSLYGNSALFGIVNVITKKGRDMKGAEVSGQAGSRETYRARLSYGDRLSAGPEFLLSGTWFSGEGDDSLYFSEFDDPATNDGIAGQIDGDGASSLFGSVTFSDFTLEGAWIDRTKEVPTASWGTVFNDPRTQTTDRVAYLDLLYEHLTDNRTAITGRLSYNYYSYEGEYAFDYGEEGAPYIELNRDDAEGVWWWGELQASKVFFGGHHFVAGGEVQISTKQDQSNYDVEVYLVDKRTSEFWALFIQDEFPLFQDFTLNIGVRYDNYDTFGGTTNPRVAAIWNPVPKTTFKYIYGKAFKAPTAYELYYHDDFETTKPNPDLDPERIDTHELIYEQLVGSHLRGTVVGYYYLTENLINLVTDPEDGLLVFTNVNEVEALGVEFELEGRWGNGLIGRISYSYHDVEDRSTGERLTNSPEHIAKFNISIPVVRDRLFLSLEEQYTGERLTVAGNRAQDFLISNLTLFGRNVVEGLDLTFGVRNLLDENYADPGSEEHLQDTLCQDGRTWFAKATYGF